MLLNFRSKLRVIANHLASALALVAGATGCADDDSESASPQPAPQAEWSTHACEMPIPEGLTEDDFTCGSAVVPVDWAQGGGPTLTLEVAVLHARNGGATEPPLVFLGGGLWTLGRRRDQSAPASSRS